MLTAAQHHEFAERGFLRLRAFSAADAAPMQEAVWAALAERHGIDRTDPSTWTVEFPSRLGDIHEEPTFAPIAGAVTRAALDALLGSEAWDVPRRWGAFHVTFPRPRREWTVPHTLWHSDFAFDLPPSPLPGVKVFTFVSDVPARTGGTLAVAGSHRLARRVVASLPPETREVTRHARLRLLESEAWLRALVSPDHGPDRVRRFMDTVEVVDGVPLEVVELTGRAGEIVLTDPWLLHCRGMNCGSAPRFMRSIEIYRRELHPKVFRHAAGD